MATVIASPTIPQLEGITRNTLLKRVLNESGLGAYGTATSGSASLIGDTTRLKSTQFDSKDWVGGWARISKDAGGAAAAPEAEISPITTYQPTHATDHITVNPAFTAAVAATDEYELWRNPSPRIVLDIIDNLITEELYTPCWTMLTEIPDGDMEQTSANADWTASNATVTKQTDEPALFGKRYLRVVTTTALGYARSALLRVEPGKQYYVSAIARCSAASTTARLIAYDETNGASIDYADSTRLYPVRLGFVVTAPSDCYTMSVRLANVENTVTTEWDEAVFFPTAARDIRLPWWVKDKSQIVGIFKTDLQTIDSNTYDWLPIGERDPQWAPRDNALGGRGLRAVSRYSSIGTTPLFMYGLRNDVAYANDNTDKKYIDSNLLVAAVCYKLFQHLSQRPNTGLLTSKWLNEKYAEWTITYNTLKSVYMERLQQVVTGPPPDVGILDSRFSSVHY